MVYVQFYDNRPSEAPAFVKGSTWYVEAIGECSVFKLDARNTSSTWHHDAKERARKLRYVRKYDAYRLFKGRFSDSVAISGIIPLTYEETK